MRFACLLAALLVLLHVHAQETKEQPSSFWSVAVYYDQDYTLEQLGLKSLNEDRNYTMGLGIVFTLPCLKKCCLYAPLRLLNRLFNRPFLNDNQDPGKNNTYSLMIANGS